MSSLGLCPPYWQQVQHACCTGTCVHALVTHLFGTCLGNKQNLLAAPVAQGCGLDEVTHCTSVVLRLALFLKSSILA